MSEENQPPSRAVPLKPPARILKQAPTADNKAAANGVENKPEWMNKLRPVSEMISREDIEKSQHAFKAPPRVQKYPFLM